MSRCKVTKSMRNEDIGVYRNAVTEDLGTQA